METLLDAAPRAGIAIGLIVVVWLFGRAIKPRLERRLQALRTPSFGRVFSSLIVFSMNLVAWLVAITMVFPSVDVAAMLGGLGLLGVAAGFAFQDILSNLLSGILLIFRQPFVTGDQIEVNGIQGTVEGITIRETQIRTFSGRLVVVPNKDVYTNAIEVQTNKPHVRTSYVLGVGYDTDLGQARELALQTLAALDLVLDDPAPQAFYTDFGASSINLDLRYWTQSRQLDIRRAQDAVTEAINTAFVEAGIDIPFDIVTLDAGDSFAQVMTGARRGPNGQGSHPDGAPRADETVGLAELETLSRAELYELAQANDVEGRSSMSKQQLAAALRRSGSPRS